MSEARRRCLRRISTRREERLNINCGRRGDLASGGISVPLLSIGSASPTNCPSELLAACPSIVIGQTVGAVHFNQLEVPEQVNLMIERYLAINDM